MGKNNGNGWGIPTTAGGNGDGSKAPVTALAAAPPHLAQGLHAALLGDGRFRVVGVGTSPEDVRAKLALQPEAILAEGTVFDGPEQFADVLGAFPGVCFVLLPQGVGQEAVDAVRGVACVKEVAPDDANFVELVGRMYEAVLASRKARTSGAPSSIFARFQGRGMLMAGWRAIGVWNPQGGVGKSTVAAALAMESASRRLPTLLVGLGAPDPIPLALGLRPEPNIVSWQGQPTPENLRALVQKVDTLDVLAGFPDPVALAGYAPHALEGKTSLPALASTAAYSGYAVVVFDISSQELAAAALVAVNTLVLVTEPTLTGVLNAVEGVRLVDDIMAGQHSIAKESIHLVVNGVRNSTLTPEEVVKAGGELREDFPAMAATIPDDPSIEEALNRRRPAYGASEPLRKAAAALGDRLLTAPAGAGNAAPLPQRAKRSRTLFGLVKVRY